MDPLALQPEELIDHRAQGFERGLGAGVGFGHHGARELVGIEVGRGAVGQALLRAQHLLQPVAAFAAKDLHDLVEHQVIGVAARNRQVAGANLGLHRAGLVDHDEALHRRWRRHRRKRRHRALRPRAEHALHLRERRVGRHVADNRHERVVGHEPGLVELHEVLTRERGQRRGGAARRHAVGMEAEHQPVDHLRRHRVGVIRRHLERRHRLRGLPLDLLWREGRPQHHVGHQVERGAQAIAHAHGVDEAQVGASARGEQPAHEVDLFGDLPGRARGRALIEQGGGEHRQALFALGILRCAGAHQHARAHHRLFVLAHEHHLQAVGQRADLVGRELHRLGRQRPRRSFRGPPQAVGHALSGREAHARHHHAHGGDERRLHQVKHSTAHGRVPAALGRTCMTRRDSGVK